MEDVTKKEMEAVLALFKDFSTDYNANSLSKVLNITSMGTLKILKRLEKQGILRSKQLGKAVFYTIDFKNSYAKTYLKFILQKEAEQSGPKIGRWIVELRKFQPVAEMGILFGSVLKKEEFNDVDLLLIIKKQQNRKVNSLLKDISGLSTKHIHTIKQTRADLKENLNAKDKVLLSIVRTGVILFGYDKIIEVIESVAYR